MAFTRAQNQVKAGKSKKHIHQETNEENGINQCLARLLYRPSATHYRPFFDQMVVGMVWSWKPSNVILCDSRGI